MSLKGTIVRKLNRHLLHRWQLVLRKAGHEGDNIILSQRHRQVLIGDICRLAAPYLTGEARMLAPERVAELPAMVEDFLEVYGRRPVRDNTGGSGFNGSLWLYLAARALQPELIVESGTWQGHSIWLLAQACPSARLHSFDIEPQNLEHRTEGVRYHGEDWTESGIAATDPARSLIFFDDHVSHARRLAEAHARGFRQVLLDDNLPAQALFLTGQPPAPTAAMLMDPQLRPGERIEWLYRGRRKSLTYEGASAGVRDLVAGYHPMPQLTSASWYRPHFGLSFLRLEQ